MFEEGERQSEQMAEDLAAEEGIDAVAGVQYQVLPQPGHDGAEDHEHQHADTDDNQGAFGLVDYDLVYDDLGEQRGGQRDELDYQRGQQDFLPDGLVFEQLGDKPFETEARGLPACSIRINGVARFFFRDEQYAGMKLACNLRISGALGRLGAGAEEEQLFLVTFDDQNRDKSSFTSLLGCFILRSLIRRLGNKKPGHWQG